MDIAFVADSQDSLIKVLDISKKDYTGSAPVPQRNIKITYGWLEFLRTLVASPWHLERPPRRKQADKSPSKIL